MSEYENKTVFVSKHHCYVSEVPHLVLPPDNFWVKAGNGSPVEVDAVEVMDWLQHCLLEVEAGREGSLLPNPMYRRADGKPPLTDEEIDKVVMGIDEELEHEMRMFHDTHHKASGAEKATEFKRLGPLARRALVEGCDEILVRWDKWFLNRIEEMKKDGTFDQRQPKVQLYTDMGYEGC